MGVLVCRTLTLYAFHKQVRDSYLYIIDDFQKKIADLGVLKFNYSYQKKQSSLSVPHIRSTLKRL
jgi:hypothetical protein